MQSAVQDSKEKNLEIYNSKQKVVKGRWEIKLPYEESQTIKSLSYLKQSFKNMLSK